LTYQKIPHLCIDKKTKDMVHGKNICNQLKEVRKRIAEENDIPLEIEECSYKGECRGTCPRCEAEVRYLENALADRLRLGKVATVAGLALGLATTTAQAQTPVQSTPISDSITHREILEEGGIGDDFIFVHVDEEPEFPGGMEALQKFIEDNMQYPRIAAENNIYGKVYVTFVIDTDGTVLNPRLLRNIGGGCGAEAIRIVKMMPQWKPGMQKGKPVRVPYNLPVLFDRKHCIPPPKENWPTQGAVRISSEDIISPEEYTPDPNPANPPFQYFEKDGVKVIVR